MTEFTSKLIKEQTDIEVFEKLAKDGHGDFVKAVVDLANNIMAIGSELHVDDEQFLLERGSFQEDLWGINIYPLAKKTEDLIEFDSMVNIRPSQNNRSRYVENEELRQRIAKLVLSLIKINA